MAITQQQRHQIFDNASTPCLDLDRYRHARRKVDRLVLDLHLSAIERDPREIEKLLPLGLARIGERPAGFAAQVFAFGFSRTIASWETLRLS